MYCRYSTGIVGNTSIIGIIITGITSVLCNTDIDGDVSIVGNTSIIVNTGIISNIGNTGIIFVL